MQLIEEVSSTLLSEQDVDWLHFLLTDWQMLVGLTAVDLVLWLPTGDGRSIAVVHCRPATSTTVHVDDIVDLHSPAVREIDLWHALRTGRVIRSPATRWTGTYLMIETCVSVCHNGYIIAAVTREANLLDPRLSLSFEGRTVAAADTLCQVMACGEYPHDFTSQATSRGVLRVLDGVVPLDARGRVQHAIPNAVSCLYCLGIRTCVTGKVLAQEITRVIDNGILIEEFMAVVVMDCTSQRVKIAARASTISMRALPLVDGRGRLGAVILTRDVSEVHRHEQELMTKGATIREIRHHIKSNLQTVSALLRLQLCRPSEEVVEVVLAEAEHRMQAITIVYAALSRDIDGSIDFGETACMIVRMAGAIMSMDHAVEVITADSFGTTQADQTQILATVLSELVVSSVEHGLADRDSLIEVRAEHEGTSVTATAADDGASFVSDTPMSGPGTQIVHQMVCGEPKGSIEWTPREGGGTLITLHVNLDPA